MKTFLIGFLPILGIIAGMFLANFFDTTAEDFKEIKKNLVKPMGCQLKCCQCRKDF